MSATEDEGVGKQGVHNVDNQDDVDQGDTEPAGGGAGRLARRYGPFVVVAAVLAAAVVVFQGGDDEDDGTSTDAVTDREELVRSGPMTPEKAELVSGEFEHGPDCDPETDRIKMPSVYAPPCVEPFDGDNVGATSQGVTDETIKLVYYVRNLGGLTEGAVEDTGADMDAGLRIQTVEDYVDLYNEVFETYGRRVEVEVFAATGAGDDTAAARADAIAIAEMEPFAVIGGPDQASHVFADELAANEVICLEGCATGLPGSFMAEREPYVWMGAPEVWTEQVIEGVAKLAGPGKAEMAGDPELREQERTYGVVYYNTADGLQSEGVERLRDGLADHGIELATDPVEYFLDTSRLQETVRTIVSKLESADVTTVLFMGDPVTPTSLTEEATAQSYFPEWILGNNYLVDTHQFARTFDPDQWRNGFGIVTRDAADEELAPSVQLYEWGYGTGPPSDAGLASVVEPGIRALFTGIHLAGPELTPGTFRDGLLRYPPSGGGPTRPTVAWGDFDDVENWPGGDITLVWWDPEAEGVDETGAEGKGMYRYADGGQRYGLGEIPNTPEEAGLFDEESSVLGYDELPPEDQTPDYPSPLE